MRLQACTSVHAVRMGVCTGVRLEDRVASRDRLLDAVPRRHGARPGGVSSCGRECAWLERVPRRGCGTRARAARRLGASVRVRHLWGVAHAVASRRRRHVAKLHRLPRKQQVRRSSVPCRSSSSDQWGARRWRRRRRPSRRRRLARRRIASQLPGPPSPSRRRTRLRAWCATAASFSLRAQMAHSGWTWRRPRPGRRRSRCQTSYSISPPIWPQISAVRASPPPRPQSPNPLPKPARPRRSRRPRA